MVALASLWLPTLLGAVAVFVASALVHMVLRWHQSDMRQIPNEDAVRAAIRAAAPGQYSLPHCAGPKEAQSPEAQKKFAEGPVAVVRVWPNGVPAMGKMLGQWLALCVGVAILTAYVASRVLAPGAAAGDVLQLTAAVGFLAYATGSVSDGIWWGKPWPAVAKDLLDALIYAFALGAPFAWLWPAA